MPVVRVGIKAFSLLVDEAHELEISVKSLADIIVLMYFGELEEEELVEGDQEDDDDDEDDEDEEE